MAKRSQNRTLGVGIGVYVERVENEAAKLGGVVSNKLCNGE